MKDVEIREVRGRELLDTSFVLSSYAFGLEVEPNRKEHEEVLPTQEEKRFLVLFEDGRPMATSGTIPMTQNVRGKICPMGGLASVGTHPSGRRKGYVRRLVVRHLREMRERGEVVSTLWPFRESFYGRLGYVSFPVSPVVRFPISGLSPLLNRDPGGEVEVKTIREGFEEYRSFLEEVQPHVHGMALRPPKNASYLPRDNEHWLAVARIEGKAAGVMLYRAKGEDVEVEYFLHRSSPAKYLLLRWLALHVDQVRDVWLHAPPRLRPETWLYDLRAKVQSPDSLSPMGRVVVVEGLSGMRVGPGSFSARITDGQCPWNEGGYRFDSVDGTLEVSRSERPDCELDIRGLSALVFAGYEPGDLVFRGWGDPPVETQEAMRDMFPPEMPYLHEQF